MSPSTSSSPLPAAPPASALHHERLAVERQLKAGRQLADALDLQRGERVLELHCGVGLLAETLADAVGPQGDVLGLDPLPLRVQIAHQHRGRRNLRFQIGGVQQLGRFPSGCFDVVIANGVLQHWCAPEQTLRQVRRLLASGGRFGLCATASQPPHPAEVAQAQVLAQAPYAAHPLPPEAVQQAVSAEALGAALQEAGFADAALEARRETLYLPHPDAAIANFQALRWGRFLDHLPVHLRASARAAIVQRLAALQGPAGIVHESIALRVVAPGTPR